MSFVQGKFTSSLEGKGTEEPSKEIMGESGQGQGAQTTSSSDATTSTQEQSSPLGPKIENSPTDSIKICTSSGDASFEAEELFGGTPSRSLASPHSEFAESQSQSGSGAGDQSINSIVDHGASPGNSSTSRSDGLSGESSFELVGGAGRREAGYPPNNLTSTPRPDKDNDTTAPPPRPLVTPTKTIYRTRTSSAIIPRRPPPKIDPSESSGFPLPLESPRRASHEGVNMTRAGGESVSSSPKIAATREHEPSRPSSHHHYLEVRSPGGANLLNPFATNFEPPTPVFISSHFPGKAIPKYLTFEWISRNGKNSLGDYSKEARIALKSIGLNSIPSLHGPLSLPYARCPSGIDAFLFSAEKDEDPWTFVLETENRPGRPPLPSVRNVPLPGNSRYSHPLNVAKGRLPARIVSAPAALESDGDTFADTVSTRYLQHRNESRTSRHRQTGSDAFTQAQVDPESYTPTSANPLRASLASAVPPYPHPTQSRQYSIPGMVPSYGATDYSHLLPSPYSYPYAWGSPVQNPYASPNLFPSFSGIPPPVYAQQPQQQAMYPNVVGQGQGGFHDPAIVSFGENQQHYQVPFSDGSSSGTYHTAEFQGRDDSGDTTDEEFSHNGFFFPAMRPGEQHRQRRSHHQRGRSESVDSESTIGGPGIGAGGAGRGAARPPSQPPLHPLVPTLSPERRSSAAAMIPHRTRRMSTTPAVTVSPRRSSSVAPQTRVVSDLTTALAKAARQPRPPPVSPNTSTLAAATTSANTTRLAMIGSQPKLALQQQQASKFLVRRPSASAASSTSTSPLTSLEAVAPAVVRSDGWGPKIDAPTTSRDGTGTGAGTRGRGGKRGRGGGNRRGRGGAGSTGGGSESSSQNNSTAAATQ